MVIQDLITSLRLHSELFSEVSDQASSVELTSGTHILYNPQPTSLELTTLAGTNSKVFIVLENYPNHSFELTCNCSNSSSVELFVLVQSTVSSSLTMTIQLNHMVPSTTASCIVRSVLNNSSHLELLGTIVVEQEAVQTNSYLNHKTLLLDSFSSVISKPELMIKNDEVKCSHGATVSSLDEKIVEYLTSRGLRRDQVVDLQIETFFSEVWQK